MIHKILIAFVIMITVMSCDSSDKKMPERKPLPITTIIADSLFTSMPGSLSVNSKHLMLICPFDGSEKFLMIYDRENGQQITRVGSLGQGPGEWVMPELGNVIDDRLVIFDLVKQQYLLANADNMYQDISNPAAIEKIDKDIRGIIYLDQRRYILFNFEETHPFKLISNDGIKLFGKYPFQEKISNAYERFQGPVIKHPQKEIMIYATTRNPYLAMYRTGTDNLGLVWENQFKKPDYYIADTKLRWSKNQPDGVSDVAFTKDFIVCLVKDFQSEATGRDVKAAPKAVYLFDYEGRLRHIFDLPYHSVRLAADAQSNSFYSICLEPDYSIVKYDLSTVGL